MMPDVLMVSLTVQNKLGSSSKSGEAKPSPITTFSFLELVEENCQMEAKICKGEQQKEQKPSKHSG